ncbi:unnamed protein product [Heligmosomoides polygyrus]|uniref:DNA_pol_D_N domain-containing protein n=1 Tax=Heligmosomoides polygyrus TaxID=6339 RepID=A0A183F9C1_HELPZ|nr:unnamed protein product [Heligmosomoides polygyrus]
MAMPEDYEPDEMMSIVSNKDFLEFEDEKQIVKLEGSIQMDMVATGCTVGLYGSQVKSDVFNVEKLVWPAPCPQRSWPSRKTGAVVAFLSGLDLTGDAASDASVITSLESLSRLLSGEDSKDLDRGSLFSRVERLVVLGESVSIGQVLVSRIDRWHPLVLDLFGSSVQERELGFPRPRNFVCSQMLPVISSQERLYTFNALSFPQIYSCGKK